MHKTKRILSIIFVVLFLSDNVRNNKLQGMDAILTGPAASYLINATYQVITATIIAIGIKSSVKIDAVDLALNNNRHMDPQAAANTQSLIKTKEVFSARSAEVA